MVLDLHVHDIPGRPLEDGGSKSGGEGTDVDEDQVSGADHVDQFLPCRNGDQLRDFVILRVHDEHGSQRADRNPVEGL